MEIKRDDAVYLEIEQFEDYELTNNVAFEMAIRKDKDFMKKDMTDNHGNKSHTENTDKMGASKIVTFVGEAVMKNNLKNYITKDDISSGLASQLIDVTQKKVNPTKQAYIRATINTKRPDMISHVGGTSKIVRSTFNMALDIEELIAQISIIKKEFNLYRDDILCTVEYLGIELEKADRLICNSNGKCIDPRDVLTKQEKMADLFFIYDCMKAKITKVKICRMMDDYYLDKKEKATSTDIKTVSKYQEIAIKYIDKMGYKELLTGMKNK